MKKVVSLVTLIAATFAAASASAATTQAAIVVSLDAETIDAGFAGDGAPKVSIPAVVGKLPNSEALVFGHEALKAPEAQLVYPIRGGGVADAVNFKRLLEYVVTTKLGATMKDAPIILSQAPLTPVTDMTALLKLMFDSYKVGSYYVVTDATAALYASGRTTGIVLEVNGDRSYTVPIYEGYVLPHAVMRLDDAHRDVLTTWGNLLGEQGVAAFKSDAQRFVQLGTLDAKLGYVAVDYTAEMAKTIPGVSFNLPSGRAVTVAKERFRAPEVLFKPNLLGLQQEGVHKLTFQSIMKCDVDVRKDLYNNVILSGVGTTYPGFADRVTREVTALAPPSMTVKVLSPPNRAHSTWIGMSILAGLSTFQAMWVSKADYDKLGADTVVKQKLKP